MEDRGWHGAERHSKMAGAGTSDISPGTPFMLTLTEIEKAVDRLTADEKLELHRYLQESLQNGKGAEPGATCAKRRISLPLIPSVHPGMRPLTADRVAEILSDDDVSH